MLPQPVTGRSFSRDRRKDSYSPLSTSSPFLTSQSGWATFLRQRSRTTNLAVILLIGIAALSVLINIRLLLDESVFRRNAVRSDIPPALKRSILSYSSSLTDLVMVPGHAIWTGNELNIHNASSDDKQWVLQDVQKGGTIATFVKHIRRGVELAAQNVNSLLVFSGGQTRSNYHGAEGQSYLRYAEVAELFKEYIPSETLSSRPFARATTEMFAMDSYENLIFSIARFREVTGHYPNHITVVGFGMKRKRFEDIHRVALKWPEERFTYIGIDDDGDTGQSYTGEYQFGLQPFLQDTYGCHTELLAKKRARNGYNRFHPYLTSAPELAPLLSWCPWNPTAIFSGQLPWT